MYPINQLLTYPQQQNKPEEEEEERGKGRRRRGGGGEEEEREGKEREEEGRRGRSAGITNGGCSLTLMNSCFPSVRSLNRCMASVFQYMSVLLPPNGGLTPTN